PHTLPLHTFPFFFYSSCHHLNLPSFPTRRSSDLDRLALDDPSERRAQLLGELRGVVRRLDAVAAGLTAALRPPPGGPPAVRWLRSEEHTSELQSRSDLVCRLLLEKKKNKIL